jgi:hypothetical protein
LRQDSFNLTAQASADMLSILLLDELRMIQGEIINPENTLVYVGVNGRELEEGLSYDNHWQAMVIADLCLEFLRHGVVFTVLQILCHIL